MQAERLDKPMKNDTKIALMEQSINYAKDLLQRIETRFDKMDERFDRIEKKFEGTDIKFERVYSKIDSNNKWLIGLAVSVIFSAATLIISLFKFFNP